MHATEIRYLLRYQRPGKTEGNALLVAGAVPTDRATVSFKVPFDAPQDGQLAEKSDLAALAKLPPEQQRPTVSAVFGMKHIKHEEKVLEGYAVRFARDAVRLVKISGDKPGRNLGALKEEPLGEWKVDLAGQKSLAVTLKLDGKNVGIEVNGKSFSAKAPADAGGFVGFAFDGTGYAALSDLKIVRP
jgi:hypothetical protein